MFEAALKNTLEWEGSYSNDPKDPGGETKFGICKRSYPKEDIANLTIERASEIYRSDYWNKALCDALPGPVAICLFDAMVNQGPVTAIKMLQDSLNIEPDGIVGAVTITQSHMVNADRLIRRFTLNRIMRYISTNNFNIFGRGWIDRSLDIYKKAFIV